MGVKLFGKDTCGKSGLGYPFQPVEDRPEVGFIFGLRKVVLGQPEGGNYPGIAGALAAGSEVPVGFVAGQAVNRYGTRSAPMSQPPFPLRAVNWSRTRTTQAEARPK